MVMYTLIAAVVALILPPSNHQGLEGYAPLGLIFVN